MRASQIIHAWDYQHGQATRVIMSGIAPLRGATMKEKQDDFQARYDYVRTSLMQEPRGHKNMLGAVLTEPATSDGDIGMLFLSPQGYFDMCGDSMFSAAAALIDSGMISHHDTDESVTIKADTVAGRVSVTVRVQNGDPISITFDNVASYSLGSRSIEPRGIGRVEMLLGYGGLVYAFVQACDVGLPSLLDAPRDQLLDVGTRVWQAAKDHIRLTGTGTSRGIDLITLWEPLPGERGARVANFYAPQTTGRTPSGTGLSARVAIEAAEGRLQQNQTFCHESLLGLRFVGRVERHEVPRHQGEAPRIIPSITARSYLMGIGDWILHPDDPFRSGFVF